MSIKIHRINKHISLDIFEVSNRTRAKQLPAFWEQALVYILRDGKIITDQIQRIGFLPNKRGFQVKTKTQTFFIRVLFKTNIPLPYVIRRVIGQDPCCARAHTLNENLAEKATDRTTEHSQKYGTFYSLNIMPCKQCFEKYSAQEYIDRVEKQRHPEFASIPNNLDLAAVANLVLVWLMQEGNAEKVIDLNDHDLFENYRVNHVRSVNRFFTSIAQYCRAVITSISEVDQKPAVKSAVQELQIIMNSCLDICADINNRPLKDISLDECYGYSEYMARYRQNAQNVAFALRYTGNECQILHNEDDVVI
jgi:hypothetical protein